jgi:hypothetical protein
MKEEVARAENKGSPKEEIPTAFAYIWQIQVKLRLKKFYN